MTQQLTLQQEEQFVAVLDLLQTAYDMDPVAMSAIFTSYVPCNEALANHPTIPIITVESHPDEGAPHETYVVSPLGLLTGVMRALGLPEIAAVFNKNDELIGFSAYTPPETP